MPFLAHLGGIGGLFAQQVAVPRVDVQIDIHLPAAPRAPSAL